MSQINLQMPDTLHHQLEALARNEGVSLDHYILYLLTRQISSGYQAQPVSAEAQGEDRGKFSELLHSLGQASEFELETTLAGREQSEAEPELTTDVIARVQKRILDKQTRM
jgi:hypothetical protein